MPMTTADVMSLLEKLGTSGVAGSAEAIRRRNIDRVQRTLQVTAPQRALLDAVTQTRGAGPRVQYRHPAQVATVPFDPKTGNDRRREEPLTPAQVAWLSRLPTDPADISHADAVEVFKLLKSVPRASDDAPLLRSIAEPLRTHHDRQQATADLEHARLSPIPVPPAALPALADAIAGEIPELTPSEALGRASEQLRAFAEARVRDQTDRQAEAQRRLERINAAEQDRRNGIEVKPEGRRHIDTSTDSTIAYSHYRAEHGDPNARAVLSDAYAEAGS